MKADCDEYNKEIAAKVERGEIERGKEEYANELNLYLINSNLVKNATARKGYFINPRRQIPSEVLDECDIPPPPKEDCSFAELMNPEGKTVDFFVSHFWGHSFERTVMALDNFAKGVYKKIGKDSADDVIFWVCLFALNQHKAAEEVGENPEDGPFNIALKEAREGAIMIIDADANPVKRIWCVFEIHRAKVFGKAFRLVVDEGDLEEVGGGEGGRALIEEIGDRLIGMRAFHAEASEERDKVKIWFRIMNEQVKTAYRTLKDFEGACTRGEVGDCWFEDFDAHVCGLIATPMVKAGLNAQSSKICLRAIRMGAAVNVDELNGWRRSCMRTWRLRLKQG